MGSFANTAGFSASRGRMLRQCPRKLYYHAYASWQGWWNRSKPPTNPRAESAYQAKNFDNASSLVGKVIHDAARDLLREAQEGRRWADRDGMAAHYLRKTASMAATRLRIARERRYVNPKTTWRLIEIETGGEIDTAEFMERVRAKALCMVSEDEAWTEAGDPMANLFVRAVMSGRQIVLVEDLVSYRVEDILVWLKVDLIMRAKRDPVHECVIVDWKTGVPKPDDQRQVGLYGHWAVAKGWSGASMVLAYLRDAGVELRTLFMTEERLEEARQQVAEYAAGLRSRLVDGDLERNEPVEEKFEATGSPMACKTCEFQIICERDGTKPRWVD